MKPEIYAKLNALIEDLAAQQYAAATPEGCSTWRASATVEVKRH